MLLKLLSKPIWQSTGCDGQVDYIQPPWFPPDRESEKHQLITDRKYISLKQQPQKEGIMSKQKTTRDTSYSKSYQLIEKNSLEAIRKLWEEHGMYGAAERLNASPYVIRYICHKNEWTRDASKVPHLVKAVQNGRAKASDFRSLDFSNVQINFKSINGVNSNE